MATTSRPAKMFRVAAFLTLAAVFASTVCGCRKQPSTGGAPGAGKPGDATPGEPVAVRVAAVQRRPIQRGIDVTGTLFADDEARVSAKVAGRIMSITRDLGDRVAPGEVLAQTDRTDYELARLQHEAALSEALSRLGLERMPESEFDVQTLPAVQRAAAQERNARARFERGQQLFQSDPPLISEQDFADLETSLEVASHNVKAEMLNGQFLLSQARSRAAELAIAQQQVQDAEIRAPSRPGDETGYVVALRMISVGEYVTPGQAVFALVDADPIKYRADAPERMAGEVRIGQPVRVRVDAFDDEFAGRVARLSPRIDPQSRTLMFEAEIPNADGRLRPGGFAVGRVDTRLEDDAIFVPVTAVVSFAGVKRLFTVVDGKAVEYRVQTGVTEGHMVEVVNVDLPAGTSVVTDGAQRLLDGQSVRIEQERL